MIMLGDDWLATEETYRCMESLGWVGLRPHAEELLQELPARIAYNKDEVYRLCIERCPVSGWHVMYRSRASVICDMVNQNLAEASYRRWTWLAGNKSQIGGC